MLPQRTDPRDGCHIEPCRKIVALSLTMKELNTNSLKKGDDIIQTTYPH